MPRHRSLTVISFATTVAIAPTGAQTMTPATRAALDSAVDWLAAKEFLPGVAVAIVSGDQIIYRRDAGWADREARRRVDANTVFYIASITKPFTALATTLLDRDGILRLDATVAQILPGVRLGDGVDPSRITVRQLLSHTHGVNGNGPVQYRAAFSGEVDRGAMLRALALHGPVEGGTAFRYSNFGYNLLSLAIDSIAGKPWQDVLAERVFRPLGFRSTSARVSEIPRDRLIAVYRPSPDGLERIPFGKADANMQAAGGIVTTSTELARFIVMEMNGGRIDGRQVFPADVIAETQRQATTQSQNFVGLQRFAYALGWQHGLLDGDTLLHHMGGFPGFSASASFMPRHRIGFVSLTNGGFGSNAEIPLMMYAYALLTGKREAAARHRATLDSLVVPAARARTSMAADRARRAERPQTMALPFTVYAGRYENAMWGSLQVSVRDGRIVVRNGVLEAVAEVYDGTRHQLRVELDADVGRLMTFDVADGRPRAVEYNGVRFDRVR
jgi:CubicO group peptidase (beta-lactamase class C family)